LVTEYINNPNVDMHQWTADYTGLSKMYGPKKGRDLAKSINFGSMYGMGVHKFARQLALPVPPPWPKAAMFSTRKEFFEAINDHKEMARSNYEAARLYFGYHDKFACIKATSKAASEICRERGYAKTLLGRRRYLDADNDYKALNTAVQGTGGDVMKLWVVQAYEAGVFETLTPLLTVHDELDISRPQTEAGLEAVKELVNIGNTCIKLRVPLKVDYEEGPNWADVKELTP
jgi:DNA polymerase-1